MLKDHERLWIYAANTLDAHERANALVQIADMAGISLAEVTAEANHYRFFGTNQGSAWADKNVLVASKSAARGPRTQQAVSTLQPPSMKRLMGSR